MRTCNKCLKRDSCGKREVFGSVGCVDDFKPKPQTNADRIRNMSDEELAELLNEFDCDFIYGEYCKNICKKKNGNKCPVFEESEICPVSNKECTVGWLKSEAQNETDR